MNASRIRLTLYCGLLLPCFVVAVVGCQQANVEICQPPPIPAFNIPNDIPGDTIGASKNGEQIKFNGKDLYTTGFKQGWEEYWCELKNGRINLADSSREPKVPHEIVYQTMGRVDGFKACRKYVLDRQEAR